MLDRARRSAGRPLDAATREELEARFDHDFSQVRVHTDSQEAAALRAQAFTWGEDVFFAPGRFDPVGPRGRQLLTHELVHTIQQGPSTVEPSHVSHPHDALEVEADRAAHGAASSISRATPLAAGIVSRSVDTLVEVAPEGKEDVLAWRVETIVRHLATDPDDASGRVRRLLGRMAPETRAEVLERVRERISGAQRARLDRALEQRPPAETESDTATAPAPELTEETAPDETGAEPAEVREAPAAAKDEIAKEGAASEKGPAPEDALKPSEEGAPKKPEVEGRKVEDAAAAKGPEAPKPAAATRPPATGGAGSAAPVTAEAGGMAEPAAETAALAGAEAPAPAATEARAEPTEPAPAAEAAPVATPDRDPAGEAGGPVPAEATAAGAEGAAEAPAAEPTEVAALPEPSSEPAEDDTESAPPPELTGEAGAPAEAEAGESTASAQEAASGQAAPAEEPVAEASPSEAEPSASEGASAASGGAASESEAVAEPEEASESEAASEEETAAGPEAAAEGGGSDAAVENPQEAAAAQEVDAPEAAPAGTQTASEGGGAPAAGAGGGCAPSGDDAAKPGAEGGDAGGGGACGGAGGAGGGAVEPPPATPPDVSQSDPPAAMGAVAKLSPAQLQTALGGVSRAATTAVSKQREELSANPPTMERPSGVPAQRDASAPVVPPGVPAPKDAKAVERAAVGESIPVPQPQPLPPMPPPPPVSAPRLPGDAPLTEADQAKVQAAVRNLPTSDPALDATAGDPPQLALAGDADPKRADEQRAKVEESATGARSQGLTDVAQPMGENDIYPTVPKESLKANPGGEAGGPGALGTLAACAAGGAKALAAAQGGAAKAGGGGGVEEETASIVAQEQRGDAIQSAVGNAQADMTGKQQDHASKVAAAKEKSQKDADALVEANAAEQKGERTKAREESLKLRTQWNDQQQTLVGDARKDALKQTDATRKQIGEKQGEANSQATQHVATGNREAASARRDAEQKAQEKKKSAEKESGGVLSWVSSKVTAFFDGLKAAIGEIFSAARKLVTAAIETAKKLATEAIELARKAVVGLIQLAGDALIAIGDRLLAGFPDLRDRFRKQVQDRVKAAQDTVNKLADKLKEGVQKLLDLLGKAINAYLGLLECAYMAAVDAVAGVVRGAIDFAKNVIKGFAAFAELIRDVAAAPMQWIKNLGSAVVSGLKNCFWGAFKSAVKNWFNSKLEEVLGLPMAIFQLLFKGCLKMKEIGKMAWEALKAAIPTVLIQLLVEKLVSMIVPAAGAILTIIEGLRAAWGTVSRIITAFALFFAFLKAVKGGNAAGPFAAALAAAGVVVIDFVANWLLARLRKPASAVAGKLREIAQKIGRALKRGLGAVKRGARAALGAVKRGAVALATGFKKGARAAGRGLKRGAQGVGHGLKRGAQTLGRGLQRARASASRGLKRAGQRIARSKVGQALGKAVRATRRLALRGKAAYQRAKDRVKNWLEKRKQDKERRKRERQAQAREKTVSALRGMFARGISHMLLKLQLLRLKIQYRWGTLKSHANAETGTLQIEGGFSPGETLLSSAIVLEEVGTTIKPVKSVRVLPGKEFFSKRYEKSVGKQYVEGELADELFGKGKYTVTDPKGKGRGTRSSLSNVRLNPQKQRRKGADEYKYPTPDYLAEVRGRDPVTGRLLEDPQEVHAIEVQTVTDFKDRSDAGGRHKLGQFPFTLDTLQRSYPPTTRITYTIIAPGSPTRATRATINEHVNKAGLASRVRVVWRIVGVL